MARIVLSESHSRKKSICNYICRLMAEKEMTQNDLAERLGKTQSWLSKKLMHCGFYAGELIEIFRVLEADPNEVGRLMVITKGDGR